MALQLDNHPFRDRRGRWIRDVKFFNSPAEDWQFRVLQRLGCKLELLKGIRFRVANQLIHKLKRDHQSDASD